MTQAEWGIVPDPEALITVLRLMEELHATAAAYAADDKATEHILLSRSYREAAEHVRKLYEEGILTPF